MSILVNELFVSASVPDFFHLKYNVVFEATNKHTRRRTNALFICGCKNN